VPAQAPAHPAAADQTAPAPAPAQLQALAEGAEGRLATGGREDDVQRVRGALRVWMAGAVVAGAVCTRAGGLG
jgi:hypothetical protein